MPKAARRASGTGGDLKPRGLAGNVGSAVRYCAPRTSARHTRDAAGRRRRPTRASALVARWVGIVSAACSVSSVSSVGSRTDGSSADAYRHSTAYGCATVNTATVSSAAISAAVMNASAANTGAPTAICERIG